MRLIERAAAESGEVRPSPVRELMLIMPREVNAQHLASVGPQADDELHPADTVDNKETTVVASDREPNLRPR